MKTLREICKGQLFYSNPLPISRIGDPYIFQASDGSCYLFATSAPDGFLCWKSEDLVHWGTQKRAYLKQADSWGQKDFWAPEVVEHLGRYFLFFSARGESGSLRINAAVSDSPDGPYRDVGSVPLFDAGYAVIDAHVFQATDGQSYLFFSRDCSENRTGDIPVSEIYGVRLSEELRSIVGTPVRLLSPEQEWEKESGSPLWNEGPEVLEHNGTFYLTYSANCYAGRSYSIGYATASHPLGPYRKSKNNPILTAGTFPGISGPGHHSFVRSPGGKELFIAYHTHTFPEQGGGNRQLNLDRAVFSETGELFVDGPSISPQPVPFSGEFQNLSAHANFQCGGLSLPLLNDGIFTVHPKDGKWDWTQEADENGFVDVTAQFQKPQRITGFSIYRGTHADRDFEALTVILDGGNQITDIPCPVSPEQRAASVLIDPVDSSDLHFRFRAKGTGAPISLSEIMIFGSPEAHVP